MWAEQTEQDARKKAGRKSRHGANCQVRHAISFPVNHNLVLNTDYQKWIESSGKNQPRRDQNKQARQFLDFCVIISRVKQSGQLIAKWLDADLCSLYNTQVDLIVMGSKSRTLLTHCGLITTPKLSPSFPTLGTIIPSPVTRLLVLSVLM